MAAAGGSDALPVEKMMINARASQGSNNAMFAMETMDLTLSTPELTFGSHYGGALNDAYYPGRVCLADQKNSRFIGARAGGGNSTSNFTFYWFDSDTYAYQYQRNVNGSHVNSNEDVWGNGTLSGKIHKTRHEAIVGDPQYDAVYSLNTYPGMHNYSGTMFGLNNARRPNFNSYLDILAVGYNSTYDRINVYSPTGTGGVGGDSTTTGISGYTLEATITHPSGTASRGLNMACAIEGTDYIVGWSKYSLSGSYNTYGVNLFVFDCSTPSSPSYVSGSEITVGNCYDYYALYGYIESRQELLVIGGRSGNSNFYVYRYDMSNPSTPSYAGATNINGGTYYTKTFSNISEADEGFLLGDQEGNYDLKWMYYSGNALAQKSFLGGDSWYSGTFIQNYSGSVSIAYRPEGLIGIL